MEVSILAEALVRWTARLFVACYLLRVGIDLAGRRDPVSQRIARWVWTAGCAICLIHIAVSMHLVHGWSHAAAYEHVLKRTAAATGIQTGVGLYVNYAFAMLWLVDVVMWWRLLDWPRNRITYWTIQVIFAFLVSQATVAFGPEFWKPVAIVVVLLSGALVRSRRARTCG